MRAWRALLALGCGLPGAALAQPVLPPSNPVELNAPRPPPRLAPSVEGPPLVRQEGPGAAIEVTIREVRVTGNDAVPERRFGAAIAGLAGATVPLSRIEEARLGILRAYREAGYPFVTIAAGLSPGPDGIALAFAVTEGFVAEVKLEGDADAIGPAGTQVLRFLNRLVGERPVSTAALERALLLASDVPGLRVGGTLRPLPTEPGALQLVVQVERQVVSGYVNVDNRGYRLVGPWQALFVGGVNSLTSLGERTEVSVFAANDSTQWFAQGSLEFFLGGSGLRMKIYGGSGETRPSGTLARIGYFGQTQVGGITANYPIVRSRPFNLYAVASFDLFDSDIYTGRQVRARSAHDQIRTFRFGWDGQLLESWLPLLPAATNSFSLRVSQGVPGLGATPNGSPLSGRSGGEEFGYLKLAGEVQRTQPLFAPAEGQMISLQGTLAGQWTNDVLPQAEKFYLGGNRLGRGYYAGQVTGDRAFGTSVELQYDTGFESPVPLPFGSGRIGLQFYLFRDDFRAVENRPTDPNRRLSSWGGGVRMVVSETVQLDLEAVHRDTRRPDGDAAPALKDTALFFRTLVRF